MKKISTIFCALLLISNSSALRADEAAPADGHKIKIILVGDSTVNDGGGWGSGFKQFLTGNVECINTAMNGRSTMSFMKEGRWTNALALHGDYYLIQFGHNNQPGKPGRSTDMPTFVSDMKKYVADARAIGAKPVLVTPLTRRQWDKENPGKINSTLEPYAAEVRKIAAEENVPLVDLHARSIELCESLGPEKCLEFSPVKVVDGTNTYDGTHLRGIGHVLFARLVVEELRKAVPALSPFLRSEPVNTYPAVKEDKFDAMVSSDGAGTHGNIQSTSAAAPALPVIPEKNFNAHDYGATGDGVTTETKAIQAAINAASAAGGGVVEIPQGIFLCGPIKLASKINLHLDGGALLRMLPMGKYPVGAGRSENLISGDHLHDVAITGSGAIDGQGAPWWPLAKTANDDRRPKMITPSNCERLLIEGITLSNSPMFHIAIGGNCSDVTVRGVTIRAPASDDPVCPSHNTDACDVKGRNILIENCDVSVGDDDFTCGGNTSDVLITNCTYGFGHGVSIGSPTHGGVSNITVINCTFNNTESGIRIKTDRDRGGFVHDLKYLNLRMTNVGCPILIYESYMAKEKEYRNLNNLTAASAAKYPAAPVGERTPVYRDFIFSNITATAQSGKRAGLIWGLPEMNVTNVLLQNVDITADRPFGIFNAKNVRLMDCRITTPEGVNKIAAANAHISTTPP